jgi:ubiquinone/menaquinone biosynthesis C-methylase UbiE
MAANPSHETARWGGLPPYAERLQALHLALVDDFRLIVGKLPFCGGERVVDAGCGDGFFTALLAERLPQGEAIGLDSSTAYLAAAEKRLHYLIGEHRVRLIEGDVNKFPMADGDLDAIWSAHSMQSYESIPHVLAEFRRVLRPGGLLAVLETDNIHSIMLSWPPDLELAVRQAEHREIGDEDSYIGTYFPRFAERLLREAGFDQFNREYVFIHRQRSCDETLERYVELYLQNLLETVGERVSELARVRLGALANRESDRFLPRQENFFFGSLQVLMTARAGTAH